MSSDPVPFADLWAGHEPILGELREAFERVVAASAFSGGAEVERFEQELATFVGTPHAVGVGSGTAALQLALTAAGIGRGDEVILPPNTFFATAEAIVAAGAAPVFADVDPKTALIDAAGVEAVITERTAAIVAVHLYGQTADMNALGAVAQRHGLFLLEDAAQAITSTWCGRQAGSLGDAAAFSFYPGKNLGALGEAGAVTTRDPAIAARVARLRTHGESAKYVHEEIGVNERMDGLQAAFLSVKLARLESMQRDRVDAVARYLDELAGVTEVETIVTDARAGHSYHLLVVRVPRRDDVLENLRGMGIHAGVHYPTPIHRQPAFASLDAATLTFPHAEALAASVLSLPLFPGMTGVQVERAVRALGHVVAGSRR